MKSTLTQFNAQIVNMRRLFVLLVVLFSAPAFGIDRYANPSNLAAQVSAAVANDVIILQPGRYTATYNLALNKTGLTLKAQTPGTAVFTGVNTQLVVQASNVTVDGLVFDGVTNPTTSTIKWVIYVRAVSTAGSTFSGIRITNCDLICVSTRLAKFTVSSGTEDRPRVRPFVSRSRHGLLGARLVQSG